MADNNEETDAQEQGGRPTTRNRRNYRPSGNTMGTFNGIMPEIGGTLVLQAETHIRSRVTVNKFKDMLGIYIVKNFKESVYVINALKEGTDPIIQFNKDNRPADPTTAPAHGSIEEMILKEEVKEYVMRLCLVKEGVNKVYELVWGQ